ncbi:hypothetical protein [Dactylosporangium cerinum]
MLCWHELPRSLAAGGAWLAATVPLLLAALAGAPGWILALAAVPPALVLTGLAAFAATVARGDGWRYCAAWMRCWRCSSRPARASPPSG